MRASIHVELIKDTQDAVRTAQLFADKLGWEDPKDPRVGSLAQSLGDQDLDLNFDIDEETGVAKLVGVNGRNFADAEAQTSTSGDSAESSEG